jgi:hypothetical protein
MAKSDKKWRLFAKKQQSTSLSRAPDFLVEERTLAKPSLNNHAEHSGSRTKSGSWFVRKGGKKRDYRTRNSTQQHNETFETVGTIGDRDSAGDNANVKILHEPNLYLFPDLYESAATDEVGDTDYERDEDSMLEVINELVFDYGVSSQGVEATFARLEPEARGRPETLTEMFGAGFFDCSQAVSFDENDAFPFTRRVSGNTGLSQSSFLVFSPAESTRESYKATAFRSEREPSKATREIRCLLNSEREHDLGFDQVSTVRTNFAVERVLPAPAPDTSTFNFAFTLPAALEQKKVASPTNEGVPAAVSFGLNLFTPLSTQDASSPRASSIGGLNSSKAESAPPSAASSVFSFGSHLPLTFSRQELVSTTITVEQYPTRTPAAEARRSEEASESTQGLQEVKSRLGEAANEVAQFMEPSVEAKIRSPYESTTFSPFEEENTTLPADSPYGCVAAVFQWDSPALSDGNSIPTQHAFRMDAKDDKIAFDDLGGKYCCIAEPSAVAKAIGAMSTVSVATVHEEIQQETELNGNRVASQQSYIDALGALSDPLNSPDELSINTNAISTQRSCDSKTSATLTSESSSLVGFARPSAHLPHPCARLLQKSWQQEGLNSEPRKKKHTSTSRQERCSGIPNYDGSLGCHSWEASIGMELTDESNGSVGSGAGGHGGIECMAEFVPDLDSRSKSCASEVLNEDAELFGISQASNSERPTLLIGGIKRRTGRASKQINFPGRF